MSNMNMRLHNQKGASLVEMAIVLLLFLMTVFAVLEFTIAIVRSAQLAEATHNGLRYAIVNDAVGGITLPACTGEDLEVEVPCDSGSCPDMINRMANIAPIIKTQEGIKVSVKYTCPVSENLVHNEIYLVTVTVSDAKHYLTVPGVLGLDVTVDLQDFASTRLSEDLHTAATGG